MFSFFHHLHTFWIVWSLLLISFFVFIQYLVQKRKKYHSIPTEFTPPQEIHPLLAGFLVDGKFHIRDYIAGYIYLIQQGVINVDKQQPEKAYFERVDLERAQVYTEKIALREGYLERKLSLTKVSVLYGILFIIVFIGFLFYIKQITIWSQDLSFLYGSYIFLGSLSFFIYLMYQIFFLAKYQFTEKGLRAKHSLLGFKKFLSVAESDRLTYFNSSQSKPDEFLAYLPYAIALGVDENWNMKYAGVLAKTPSWYSPTFIRLPIVSQDIHSIIHLIDMVQETRRKEI